MDEIKKAMLGDKEAQRAVTERGELLPCPFCGGEPEIFRRCSFYGVRCADESCNGYDVSAEYSNRYTVIHDYNTRPQILTAEELERLEGMECDR